MLTAPAIATVPATTLTAFTRHVSDQSSVATPNQNAFIVLADRYRLVAQSEWFPPLVGLVRVPAPTAVSGNSRLSG
jgi:hypothetical protein